MGLRKKVKSWIDIAIILAYLAGTTLFGCSFFRKGSASARTFMAGGGKLPGWFCLCDIRKLDFVFGSSRKGVSHKLERTCSIVLHSLCRVCRRKMVRAVLSTLWWRERIFISGRTLRVLVARICERMFSRDAVGAERNDTLFACSSP